jgi:hypothetical protein
MPFFAGFIGELKNEMHFALRSGIAAHLIENWY